MWISCLSFMATFVLLAPAPEPRPEVPKKLERVPDGSAELRQELLKFDTEYRHGSEEKFAELEKLADKLAKQFPDRDERARIWYEVAHVAGQSGIDKQAPRVRIYATKCLEISRDPVQRGRMYTSLACCVNMRGHEFPKGRREAAEILFAGYIELLAQELPEQAPEMPHFKGSRVDGIDNGIRPQAEIDALMEARKEAEFVRDLVSRRKTFIMQFRDLYKPAPNYHGRTADGLDELRALARKKLTEHQVNQLMDKVMK